jgi:hypothetical protein
MSDYDKLTVVKLRDELVKRGLPKSGLKAVLVNRLIEADAQAGNTQVAQQKQEPEESTQDDEKEKVETRITPPAQGHDGVLGDGINGSDALQIPVEKVDDSVDRTAGDRVAGSAIEPEPIVQDEVQSEEIAGNTTQSAEALPQAPRKEVVGHGPDFKPSVGSPLGASTPTEAHAPQMESVEPQSDEHALSPQVLEWSAPTADSTQIAAAGSTHSSAVSRQELQEDTNKRKRRSQSPPPSSMEIVQKRARADDGRPHVQLPEDVGATSAPFDEVRQPDANMADAPIKIVSKDMPTNGQTHLHADIEMVEDDPDKAKIQAQPQHDQKVTTTHPTTTGSPSKPSPSDTRFKNLFTASSKREGSPPPHTLDLDNDDRIVTPATHPATSALYIRDLTRPLQPGNLKDHLIALATPPGSALDTEVITDFYLDSVRTHCLAGFTNTSAASRVRSGLHGRVWPDERTRKPLWVDFVPEEKLKKWIEVESEASTRRGQAAKRWEVVYEEEDDGLKAYLQEAGSNSSAPRPGPLPSSRIEAGQGVQGAPSGPRIRDAEPRTSQSGAILKIDSGKGFQALNDLFESTAAKPKLYYLPVTRSTVNRRLDMLAAGRGGGRGNEMRRYTFDEDVIVDRGPEFGSRGRGGYGGRGGGYGGGYQGRGGGWRGDRRDRR